MNTNLNNIPLEIFLDYISEHTGQEWNLGFLYIAATHLYDPLFSNILHDGSGCDYKNRGCPYEYNYGYGGCGYWYCYENSVFDYNKAFGSGVGYNYGNGNSESDTLSEGLGCGLEYGYNNHNEH